MSDHQISSRQEYAQGVLRDLQSSQRASNPKTDTKPLLTPEFYQKSQNGCTFSVIHELTIEDVKVTSPDKNDQNKPAVDVMFSSIRDPQHKYVTTENGLMHAILTAYNNHHALILTPDDIWLAIVTQFSFFMGKHGSEIRNQFVSFEDKKEIVVVAEGEVKNANWTQLCSTMSDELVKHIKDPSVREWIVPNFSTTTPTHKIAGLITLFSTLQQFFEYKFIFMCGIPQFTLQGTVADWENIQLRFDRFLDFKYPILQKWHAVLAPVLHQFTESAKGNINVNFWQRICKYVPVGSGGQKELTGWAAGFNYFDASGTSREGSVLLTSDLASGVCSVPIQIDDNGVQHKCKLVAGHSSYAIVNKNTLQPNVEWSLQKSK